MNPLIKPCACAGSMAFTHVKCIKEWLKAKIYKKVYNQVWTYSCKAYDCELCKRPYKSKYYFIFLFLIANFDLFEYERPSDVDYIIFEAYKGEKISGGSKSIFLFNLFNYF